MALSVFVCWHCSQVLCFVKKENLSENDSRLWLKRTSERSSAWMPWVVPVVKTQCSVGFAKLVVVALAINEDPCSSGPPIALS